MSRSRVLVTLLAFACLVVGAGVAGMTSAELVATDGGEREPETTVNASSDPPVAVDVDCNRSRVELTAPETYQSDLTVAVVNVTATGDEVASSTVGPIEGNETVEFTGEGVVFAFVANHSADDGVVATDVADCPRPTDSETRTPTADVEPDVRIDCDEGAVRFNASAGTEYVAKVSVVSVSPTGTSSSSTTRTVEGNATVSLDEPGLVAAFASTGELGDDRTVSAIRHCPPAAAEQTTTTANETG